MVYTRILHAVFKTVVHSYTTEVPKQIRHVFLHDMVKYVYMFPWAMECAHSYSHSIQMCPDKLLYSAVVDRLLHCYTHHIGCAL